jgi:hypothetical protein
MDLLGQPGEGLSALAVPGLSGFTAKSHRDSMPAMNNKLGLSVLFAAALASAGCKKHGSTPKVAMEITSPSVRLLDAGKDPKEPLRFHIEKGAKETLVMTMRMAMEMKLGDVSPPAVKVPPMKMSLDHEVTGVSPEGDSRIEFTVSKVEVLDEPSAPAEVVSNLKQSLVDMIGLKGHSVISPRGISKEASITVPADASQELRQSMESMKSALKQMTAPFPEEPIGEGGKWEVATTITTGGMTVQQTAQYELLRREGDKVSAKVSISQKADPQDMNPPGLPPDVKVRLLDLASSGAGEMTFDLHTLIPKSMMQLKTNLTTDTHAGGSNQRTHVKLDLGVEMDREGRATKP